jgi:hypothetical protein
MSDADSKDFVAMPAVRADERASLRIHELDGSVLTTAEDIASIGIEDSTVSWTARVRIGVQGIEHCSKCRIGQKKMKRLRYW